MVATTTQITRNHLTTVGRPDYVNIRDYKSPKKRREKAMTVATPPRTATAITLAADPVTRYRTAILFVGQWITLISGDLTVEGRLINVEPPDPTGDSDNPLVTIDSGRARVTGPLLTGDILAR
jgi:hypothetical protein